QNTGVDCVRQNTGVDCVRQNTGVDCVRHNTGVVCVRQNTDMDCVQFVFIRNIHSSLLLQVENQEKSIKKQLAISLVHRVRVCVVVACAIADVTFLLSFFVNPSKYLFLFEATV
ncbi:unnamed protein product, partial [Lymnaea stagnalis]